MISLISVSCTTSPFYYNDEVSDSFLSPADDCVICCPNPVLYRVKARKYRYQTKEEATQKATDDLTINGPIYARKNPSYHSFTYPEDSILIGDISSLYLDYNLTGKKGACCDDSPTIIQFANLVNCAVSQSNSGNTIRISKKMKDFNGDFSFDILTLCNDIVFHTISATGRFLYIKESSCRQNSGCNKCEDKCKCK